MAIEIGVSASTGDLTADLAEANRFTPEELELNRCLKISNAQMLRLALQAMKPAYSAIITLVGWLIFVEVMQMFVPRIVQALFLGKTVPGWLPVLLGCIGATFVAIVQSSKRTLLLLLDVTRGVAAQVEGYVSASWTEEETQGLDRFHGEKKHSFRYVVKGEEFEVTEKAYDVLHTKYDSYRPKVRLFYTPQSKMLVSIEPI